MQADHVRMPNQTTTEDTPSPTSGAQAERSPVEHLEHLAAIEASARADVATAEQRRRVAFDAERGAEREVNFARSAFRESSSPDDKAELDAAEQRHAACERALAQAHDALERAAAVQAAAGAQLDAAELDPALAIARIAQLERELSDVTSARDASAAKAADTIRAAQSAEASLARLADAALRAREDFDADTSRRAAYVKAKAAHDDAKIDVDRARRLATDASGIVAEHDEACRKARGALEHAKASRGAIEVHAAPIVARMTDAYRALAASYLEHRAHLDDLRRAQDRYVETTGDERARDALSGVFANPPSIVDLRRRALERLRAANAALADDDPSKLPFEAIQWIER